LLSILQQPGAQASVVDRGEFRPPTVRGRSSEHADDVVALELASFEETLCELVELSAVRV